MKKILTTLFILLNISTAVFARTIYVTDDIKFTLRSSESNRSKILKMLPSGTTLSVIGESSETGYTKVRTGTGIEGFILTNQTINRPASRWYLNQANKKLEALQKEFDSVKQELGKLKGNNSQALSSNQSLTSERDKLSTELNDLRQTASNAIQLKHQRNQFQERVISAERELKQVKRANQELKDSSIQDWFLVGGIVSMFSVLLGFILPKLSWRRKTSNWDTF